MARGPNDTHVTWDTLEMQILQLHSTPTDSESASGTESGDGHMTEVVVVDELRSDQVQDIL